MSFFSYTAPFGTSPSTSSCIYTFISFPKPLENQNSIDISRISTSSMTTASTLESPTTSSAFPTSSSTSTATTSQFPIETAPILEPQIPTELHREFEEFYLRSFLLQNLLKTIQGNPIDRIDFSDMPKLTPMK